jgi:orotate phosphoribosyltransferase
MGEPDNRAEEAARIILDSGAVYTRAGGEPFYFSSGWASPVFVDLKRLISFPAARSRLVKLALARIDEAIPAGSFEQVAGCELAGVPFATMVADRLGLPLVVALKQARGFDRLSQFEGTFEPGTGTLLVDDLTTDGRTKQALKGALERAQAHVVAIFVFFNYGIFPEPPEILSLTTLAEVVRVAGRDGTLPQEALAEVKAFAEDAPRWSRRHGGIAAI